MNDDTITVTRQPDCVRCRSLSRTACSHLLQAMLIVAFHSAVFLSPAFGDTAAISVGAWVLGAPLPPELSNPQEHSVNVAIRAGDGNPSSFTQYAIRISPAVGGNEWIQSNGVVAATAFYQTATDWGIVTVSGLTRLTPYTFRAQARSIVGSNVPSDESPPSTLSTLPLELTRFLVE